MKKKLSVICSLFLLLLVGACKKEDSVIDRNSIKLLVLEPILTGDTSDPQKRDYIIRGAIVGPASIDIADHGFVINASGNTFTLPLGSAKKTGSVESNFSGPFYKSDLSIVLYAILANGDTLTSNGKDIPVKPLPLTIDLPNHIANKGTDEMFYTTVYNLDTANYMIIEQGIEYEPLATYTGSLNGRYSGPAINSVDALTPVSVPVVPSSSLFTPGGSYKYRIYVVIKTITTGKLSYLYTDSDSFVAVMP